ncbi:MAG: hypothetical protein Q7R47_06085, partial [Candidatus Diapherotrites archaeon]|nr:hypothetical protein [Candidatus Diapherotrites archaeon]
VASLPIFLLGIPFLLFVGILFSVLSFWFERIQKELSTQKQTKEINEYLKGGKTLRLVTDFSVNWAPKLVFFLALFMIGASFLIIYAFNLFPSVTSNSSSFPLIPTLIQFFFDSEGAFGNQMILSRPDFFFAMTILPAVLFSHNLYYYLRLKKPKQTLKSPSALS